MARREKCSACRVTLVWAKIDGRLVLVCGNGNCVRVAVTA